MFVKKKIIIIQCPKYWKVIEMDGTTRETHQEVNVDLSQSLRGQFNLILPLGGHRSVRSSLNVLFDWLNQFNVVENVKMGRFPQKWLACQLNILILKKVNCKVWILLLVFSSIYQCQSHLSCIPNNESILLLWIYPMV